MSLIEAIMPYSSIALIGMAKNVGKTTVLNYLISNFAKIGQSLAITGIGRDGEDIDIVTKTSKPRIYVSAGTIIATAENLLPLCDATLEIISISNFDTPMGRVILAKTRSAGFVQIGGPGIIAHMEFIVNQLKRLNPDKILIDGAISRKSLATPGLAESVILSTGAALGGTMAEIIAKTRHTADLFCLPRAEPNEGDIYLPGAITDTIIRPLLAGLQKNTQIIADNASKIFISPDLYDKLRIKGGVLAVRRPIALTAITVNPTSPHGNNFPPGDFLAQMQAATQIPCYDVGV